MGSARNTAIIPQNRMPLDDTTRRSYSNSPTRFKIINLSYRKSSKFKVGPNQSTQQFISPFIFYISFQKGEEGEKAKTIIHCSEEQKFATQKNLKV